MQNKKDSNYYAMKILDKQKVCWKLECYMLRNHAVYCNGTCNIMVFGIMIIYNNHCFSFCYFNSLRDDVELECFMFFVAMT